MLRAKFCAPGEIIAGEPNDQLRGTVPTETGIAVTDDNLEVARSAETILLGVKPAVVLPVIREIAAALEDKLVISLAAGVRLESMQAVAPARYMRVMTNTPSAICRGASAIAPGGRTTMSDLTVAEEIFTAVGIVVQMNTIDRCRTLLAGSGRVVYTVLEALAEASNNADGAEAALRWPRNRSRAATPSETGMSPRNCARWSSLPAHDGRGLSAMEKIKDSGRSPRRSKRDTAAANGAGIFCRDPAYACHPEPRSGEDSQSNRIWIPGTFG